MKIAYFDCFAGVAGDMILGALVDAGLNLDELKTELSKLKIEGFDLTAEKSVKNGITGTKVHVITEEQNAHRHLHHINEIIGGSSLSDDIKSKAKRIFQRLAEAEARIHNIAPEKIHFHEVGALDAIVDIVGGVIGLELLGVEKVYVSKIHVGEGFVECQHGKIPVPAPATVELLKNVPIYSTGIDKELTTPTGAAIMTTLAEGFGTMPDMQMSSIGYGAGRRDLEIPNMLRVMIGESSSDDYETDTVTVIETNIDDMNPQLFDYLFERLMENGALDVYITPIQMKKSRPGSLLTVLSPNDRVKTLYDIVFAETTTIGIRLGQVERRKLKRETKTVDTEYGPVKVKITYYDDKIKNITPEYDDCKKIAAKSGQPLKRVIEDIKNIARDIIKR